MLDGVLELVREKDPLGKYNTAFGNSPQRVFDAE